MFDRWLWDSHCWLAGKLRLLRVNWSNRKARRGTQMPVVHPEPRDPRLDPRERALPMGVQVHTEEHMNAIFGLPPVWRCPCGGRPFKSELTCPRCGRTIDHDWTER
jgi:hypothetical protein